MSVSRKIQSQPRDLVLGLGATGLSVARFLKRTSGDAHFIDTRAEPPGLQELDEVWPNATVETGDVELPEDIVRVVVSPGINDRDPLIAAAKAQGIPVVSDIELFMQVADAPVAGITGSNGKSTVTTLIAAMCDADAKNGLAGGNLGRPALDLLNEDTPDWYVLELSSFQLQRTHQLPLDVAVLLNVSPDHLDWHASLEEYHDAKYRIFAEARAIVYNADDARAAEIADDIEYAIGVSLGIPAEGHYGIRSEDGRNFLARGDVLLFAVEQLAMVGRHNQFNALVALAAGELMGLSQDAMLAVLCEFPGLPHRMQRVVRVRSVDYINDSKATNVAAAIASIESIDGMLILIAGGEGKGGDFSQLRPALAGKLRAAVLIGTDAELIASGLGSDAHCVFAADMNEAVAKAASLAELNDTVLLAPACASFDQFSGYAERGDTFAAAARGLPS